MANSGIDAAIRPVMVTNDSDAGFNFSAIEIALVRGSLKDACKVAVALIEASETSEANESESSSDAPTLAPKGK